MAKLCKPPPPLQGMLLLAAFLLLVSIQAGPSMALVEQAVEVFKNLGEHVPGLGEKLHDEEVKVVTDKLPKNVLNAVDNHRPELQRFTKGVRKAMNLHKRLCKAQKLMAKLNPDADGDHLSRFSFSYYVTSASQGGAGFVPSCWSWQEKPPQEVPLPASTGTAGRASTPLLPGTNDDGLYYVPMTGVSVGQGSDVVVLPTTTTTMAPSLLLLSSAQPVYTYIESGLYGVVKDQVMKQMKMLNNLQLQAPPTLIADADNADKLCYSYSAATPLRLARVAIRLVVAGRSNNVFQQTTAPVELGGADGTVWSMESPSKICLGILPAATVLRQQPVLVLGSMIQSGRIMTVDLDLTPAAGGLGTLTF